MAGPHKTNDNAAGGGMVIRNSWLVDDVAGLVPSRFEELGLEKIFKTFVCASTVYFRVTLLCPSEIMSALSRFVQVGSSAEGDKSPGHQSMEVIDFVIDYA